MKIIGWTHWDDLRFIDREPATGAECDQRKRVIADELRLRGYKFNGYYHQDGEYGVPVFDDGTLFQCTYRTWGGIMALAYPEDVDNSEGLGYIDWAWYSDAQRSVYPTHEDLRVLYGFDPAGSDLGRAMG